MKPTDEEFEIVEEIVDDLDYFYEEDEEISGTIKVRRKLLIRNILLVKMESLKQCSHTTM